MVHQIKNITWNRNMAKSLKRTKKLIIQLLANHQEQIHRYNTIQYNQIYFNFHTCQ